MFSSARLTFVVRRLCALFRDVLAQATEAPILDLDELETICRFHFHKFVASREAVSVFAAAVARVDRLLTMAGGRLLASWRRVSSCRRCGEDVQLSRGGCRLRGEGRRAHRVGLFDLAERSVNNVEEGEEVGRVGGLDQGLRVRHPHPEVVFEVPGQLPNQLFEDVMRVESFSDARVAERGFVGVHSSGKFVDVVGV